MIGATALVASLCNIYKVIEHKKALFIIFISGLSVFVSYETLAGLTGSFKPAKNSVTSDQRRTVSSGSRSSCQPSVKPGELELLVPEHKVIHRTSRKNPTFYVHSNTTRKNKVNFILTDLAKTNPIYQKQISINSPGVKPISLPPQVRLEENAIYTWNLAIPCQNNPSRYQTVLFAGIEYSPNQSLAKQVHNAKSISEQIQIYAENGIWYEAIELAIKHNSRLGSKNYLQTFNTFFDGESKN